MPVRGTRGGILASLKTAVWLGYAGIYAYLFVGGYARIVFTLDAGDLATAHEHCLAAASCGPRHDTFVAEQVGYLSTMATFLVAAAWGMVVLDGLVLAVAWTALRQRSAARWLRILGPVEGSAVVATLVGYLLLLQVGSARLADIPDTARVGAYEIAFDEPFATFGTYYFLTGFALCNTAVVAFTLVLAVARRRATAAA